MKKKDANKSAKIIFQIFSLVILLLVANIVYLSMTGKHFVSGEDISEYSNTHGGSQKVGILYAKRGTIYSSDNEVLASDVKKYKLIAVVKKDRKTADDQPAYVVNADETAEKLAPILGVEKQTILEKLTNITDETYQVEFGSYGNNLSSLIKDQIESLDLPGLEFEELRTRNYRYGDFASYLIGYAQLSDNDDGSQSIVGKMGIELAYDDQLKGTDGQRVYLASRQNYTLPNGVLSEIEPKAGNDIYLTIDTDIQTELDLQMKTLVEKQSADKATCAIMEAKTGRILAVSNYPSFDPNKRDLDNYVDLFLDEAVEPGSIFKSFVYANALTDKKLNLQDTYLSGKFYYDQNLNPIKDYNDGEGWGVITYQQGFYHSSNVGICNILTKFTDKESLLQDYDDLGFFQPGTVDHMSTASGVGGYKNNDGRLIEYLTTGFGQGSTATAYQILRAYSTFANDGKYVEPYFVDKIVDSQTKETVYQAKTKYSKQIYSSEAISQMKDLMSGVLNIEGSTGYAYHMEDIHLIGKTGTGQVAKDGAYMSNYYTHSFAGLAPYDDPQIVIVLWYQAPMGSSKASSELVSAVVRTALNKLNSQPAKEVETSTYILDSYTNQSTHYVSTYLSEHQLTPIVIGNGDTIIGQYPHSQTEVTSKSRVFLQTNGTEVTMPAMEGWSRKEAEAFASMANIQLQFHGQGAIFEQSVTKGTQLQANQEVIVNAK